MTLLACIPVTGCLTLAEVAACSLTTAHQTFALDAGTQVIFEQADGDDILRIYEATRGFQTYGHNAFGNVGIIDDATLHFGVTASNVITVEEICTVMTTDYVTGMMNLFELDPSAPPTSVAIASQVTINTATTNAEDFGSVVGLVGEAYHQGSGDINTLEGFEFSATNVGIGNINTFYGALIYNVFNVGGGDVGTAYALYIADSFNDIGVLTTQIGLYIEDQDYGLSNFAIVTNGGHIVFNEGSHDDTDFRVEGATDTHLLFTDGSADRVGINDSTPDGKLDIVQSSTTGAIPVIELEQLDLSEEFFNFVGTVATGNPIEAAGAKTLTTTHFIRVAVNGSFLYVPVGTIA